MARDETSAVPPPVALCGAVCFMPDRDPGHADAAGKGSGALARQAVLCFGIYCFVALAACAMAVRLP